MLLKLVFFGIYKKDPIHHESVRIVMTSMVRYQTYPNSTKVWVVEGEGEGKEREGIFESRFR